VSDALFLTRAANVALAVGSIRYASRARRMSCCNASMMSMLRLRVWWRHDSALPAPAVSPIPDPGSVFSELTPRDIPQPVSQP
jgi:hypothetical protein